MNRVSITDNMEIDRAVKKLKWYEIWAGYESGVSPIVDRKLSK
jgi:hypothetical protein